MYIGNYPHEIANCYDFFVLVKVKFHLNILLLFQDFLVPLGKHKLSWFVLIHSFLEGRILKQPSCEKTRKKPN